MANKDTIALKEMEELTKSIGKGMDDLATKSERHLEVLTNSTDQMKKIVDKVQDSESLSKAINKLKEKEQTLLKANWGVNEDLKNEILGQVTAAKEALSIEQKRQQVVEQVSKAAKELGDSLGDSLDTFQSKLEEVPVIGKGLSKLIPVDGIKKGIGKATSSFTKGFGKAFTSNLKAGKGFVGSFSAGMTGGMAKMGKVLKPLLTNPYTAAALAILAVVSIGVIGFYKLQAAAKQFREETGLLNSQTKGLESQIGNVVKRTAGLGASAEDVAQAAAAFSREFGNIEQASDSVLTSVVTLNKNYGVGVEEATRLNKVFQNIGGLSAEQSQFLVAQTSEMARMAGVAPRQVIQDMAESAEYAYKYFQGSPEKLRDAAVQAAKLGTSIKEAGKVADNLLDFENSITKELEASAILGTNLNFGRARYLASTGKIFESQQAVNDEVAKLGDLTKLNTWQQQALSEATGMEYESLVNQQRIREQFGKLDEEKLSAALAYAKTGKDITKLSMKDLDILTEEQRKNQEMQSQFDQMGNRLKEIGMQLLVFLAPIGEMLFALFDGILSPALNAIQGVFDALAPLKTMMADIFGEGAGIADIFKFIGTLIGGILALTINWYTNTLKGVLGIVTGIWNVVKGIFTGDFELIFDGLMSIGMGALRLFKEIPMILLDTFFDMFPKLGDAFTELFTSIGSKVKQMFTDMLPSWAVKLLGGGTSVAAGATPPATESINDGVIQNGKVVSTHPEDFLIATKNPSGLAESMAGGMANTSSLPQTMSGGNTISMEGVITELRELKAAFLANKDVYMDRTKVSTLVRRTTERATDNNFGTLSA
jgi:hypothetical protein